MLEHDDLGLGGLAPVIDTTEAVVVWSRVRSRRRRARQVSGLAATVMLIAGIGVVAALLRPNHTSHVRTLDRPVERPVAVATTQVTDGIRVTVRAPNAVVDIGSRFAIGVTVTNEGATPVHWQAGGCGNPAELTFVDPLYRGPAPPVEGDTRVDWDGDPAGLAAALRSRPYDVVPRVVPDVQLSPVDLFGCTANAVDAVLQPGQHVDDIEFIEVPAGIEARPHPAQLSIWATFTGWHGPTVEHPATFGSTTRINLQLRVPAGLSGTGDAAANAMSNAPGLGDWVARATANQSPYQPKQSFSADLRWWRGAWELWLLPTVGQPGPGELRVRWDPETRRVVDVRQVRQGQAPEDDPDVETTPGRRSAPDTIYYHP